MRSGWLFPLLLLRTASSFVLFSPGVLTGLESARPNSWTMMSACLWSASVSQPSSVHRITLLSTRPSRTSHHSEASPPVEPQAVTSGGVPWLVSRLWLPDLMTWVFISNLDCSLALKALAASRLHTLTKSSPCISVKRSDP